MRMLLTLMLMMVAIMFIPSKEARSESPPGNNHEIEVTLSIGQGMEAVQMVSPVMSITEQVVYSTVELRLVDHIPIQAIRDYITFTLPASSTLKLYQRLPKHSFEPPTTNPIIAEPKSRVMLN